MKAANSGRTERQGVGLAMTAFESLGFAFREQTESDFGIDAHVELIESEQPTGQLFGIQLKSGPSYLSEINEDNFVFRADQQHVEYWLNHALPVLICLCDVDSQNIYWQIVNKETSIPTGKQFKFYIPNKQKVDTQSALRFHNYLTPVIASERYTIFKTDDVSHGAAKRYSFEIVVNGTANKEEIAAIIRQATNSGAKRRYYRSHLVKGRWGDSDAHVVWTFIYPSAEDHARRNHICRSIWIHENLPENFRPLGFEGENVGDNIIVDWSSNYDFFAEHVAKNTLTKEEYLSGVLPLIKEMGVLLLEIGEQLSSLSCGELTEANFLSDSKETRTRINEIYIDLSDISFAPFECRDMDLKLDSFIAYMDNISLFFSDKGLKTWNSNSRLMQALKQRELAIGALQQLNYEISKVR